MLLVNWAIIVKFMKAKCENTSQALNEYATKGTAMVVTVSITYNIYNINSPNFHRPSYREETYTISAVLCFHDINAISEP